jgi:hypothetical protein
VEVGSELRGVLVLENVETAKHVSELLLEINERLSESIGKVQDSCSPEEFLIYRRRVGTLVYSIFEQILDPIYIKHPGLKPPELEI